MCSFDSRQTAIAITRFRMFALSYREGFAQLLLGKEADL